MSTINNNPNKNIGCKSRNSILSDGSNPSYPSNRAFSVISSSKFSQLSKIENEENEELEEEYFQDEQEAEFNRRNEH